MSYLVVLCRWISGRLGFTMYKSYFTAFRMWQKQLPDENLFSCMNTKVTSDAFGICLTVTRSYHNSQWMNTNGRHMTSQGFLYHMNIIQSLRLFWQFLITQATGVMKKVMFSISGLITARWCKTDKRDRYQRSRAGTAHATCRNNLPKNVHIFQFINH